jgi:hypothetical protein
MTPSEIERRRADRVRLSRPLVGRLAASDVVVADVSTFGAGVQHRYNIPNQNHAQLEFRWRDEAFSLDCRVVRSRVEQFTHGPASLTVFHTGLSFDDVDAKRLEKIVAAHAARAARRIAADALLRADELPTNLNDLFDAFQDRQSGFVCCKLEQNRWRKSRTTTAEQPLEGFTVSAAEDPAQIELLCRTYRRADAEGRRLIRIFAQLSITEGEAIDSTAVAEIAATTV